MEKRFLLPGSRSRFGVRGILILLMGLPASAYSSGVADGDWWGQASAKSAWARPAIPPGSRPPGESWWKLASRSIQQMEYRITPDGGRPQAPNRAHHFRTSFGDGTIEVAPREATGSEPAWSWSWETISFGRSGPEATLNRVSPAISGARALYDRGPFEEWYENGPSGLEQGFTLRVRSEGEGPVRITGRIGGSLRPAMTAGAQTIEFEDAHGCPALKYGKLAAFDASGSEVPGHLVLDGDRVSLVFDDSRASYPIRIDPLLQAPDWIFDGEEPNAMAGPVCTAGDVNGDGYSDLAVGAFGRPGSDVIGRAYLFLGVPGGLALSPVWQTEAEANGEHYGLRVAPAGDVNGDGHSDLAVSDCWIGNANGFTGRVYVYYGSAAGLAETADWIGTAPESTDGFGMAIDGAGDVNGDGYDDLLVGCDETFGAGGAWLYLGSPSGLSAAPAWQVEGEEPGSHFGYSASGAGDVNADGYMDLVVGAEDQSGSAGRAYLYLGSPAGPGAAVWVADGEGPTQLFGRSVARAGDVDGDGYADVIIGAPLCSTGGASGGRAYLYRGAPTGLTAAPAWTATAGVYDSYFGGAVATAGDVNGDGLADVLIGAQRMDGALPTAGAVFAYYGSRTGLGSSPDWSVEGEESDCEFGAFVSTAGDVNGDGFSDVAASALHYGDDVGRVSLWLGSGDGPRTAPGWVIETNQALAWFGRTIAGAGDVNGDGFEEILVGAPGYDNGQADEGAIFLFFGHEGGPSILPDWWAESNQAGAQLGLSAASAGDVDGDGYDDVLAGAPYFDGTHVDDGWAFLWRGTPGTAPPGTPANAAWAATAGQTSSRYGWSVAGAGDVNGDGYGDLVIGVPWFTSGQTHEGAAGLYLGAAAGPDASADWIVEGNEANGELGYAVAGAGDVNRDRYSDVIVGAPFKKGNDDEPAAGRVFLYFGQSSGLPSAASWQAMSHSSGSHFGWSVASAGDVNGDGHGDLVIGAPDYSGGAGLACVFHGHYAGPSGSTMLDADFACSSAGPLDRTGYAVGSAGDVNGDGYSDIVVGVPYGTNLDTGAADCGWAWFLPGTALGVGLIPAQIFGAQAHAGFGAAVASADVNGDGFDDLLVGGPWHDQGQTEEGRAFVYYGNNSRGLGRAPDQWQSGFGAPVGQRGIVFSSTAVGLRAQGRSAAGRTSVRLEWRITEHGYALWYGGRGSWFDTGAPGSAGSMVALSGLETSLWPLTGYCAKLRVASDDPRFPRTPWFSTSDNGILEADFWTAGASAEVAENPPAVDPVPLQAVPNPSAAGVILHFSLGERARVRLAVHDAAGRSLRVLTEREMGAGLHEVTWDGRDDAGRACGSGIYWARLVAGERRVVCKVVRAR